MRLFLRLLLLSAVCLSPFSLRATIMVPLSVKNLTQKAELILHGTITSKVCLKDEEGNIYTKLGFNVSEVWKGSLNTNGFVIIHGGGTVGDTTTVVGGQAEYEVGEEIVAFLRLNARGEGVSIGLAQGKFQVWREAATGNKFAHNLFHGEPKETESAANASLRAAAGTPKRLGLTELRQQIERGGR